MIIEKKQKDKNRNAFNWSYFDSGREGFKHVLRDEELKGKKILIPGYIGYSTREGSGVFDPIRESKTEYVFYNLDENLNINIESLKGKIRENRNNILFLIHYFGFIDQNLETIKQYAREHNGVIIEDFAHAFFTFWLNPIINFDWAIFSLHKLFPLDSGGLILGKKKIKSKDDNGSSKYDLFNYNLKEITQKRIKNYEYLLSQLKEKSGLYEITILREELNETVPQTFPVLLPSTEIRDHLYFEMNKQGYGVVSLYHTLVDEIDSSFTIEHGIAGRILNLPVHQDIQEKDLEQMLGKMFTIIEDYQKVRK